MLSDRILREDLFTDPDRAYAEGLELATRWHGKGRTRYAVTPRFSLSCTDPLLASAGELLRAVPGSYFTSHLNENPEEIRGVRELFGCDYTATYDKHGLLTERSVLAHNVHPTRSELQVLGRRGVSVAHCPTSNAALGSGLFPLGSHLAFGIRVALGSDVGAGTGFSLFKEGLQAYFAQQLLGLEGHRLTAGHLLHLATAAGADVLGLSHVTGDLSVGKSTTPSGSAPRRAARSTWRSGTPSRPTTRWPRRSRWPRRPTYGRPGSPAPRFVCSPERRKAQQTADESLSARLQRLLGLGDREAPALGEGRLGRYGDLLGVGDHVEQGRRVGAERPGDRLLEGAGSVTRRAWRPRAVATAAMSGLSSSVPNSGSPPCSCSSLTMPSRPLSKTTTVTGRPYVTAVRRSPSSIISPPSPLNEITCRDRSSACAPSACGIALAIEPRL